ncbi:MAG TPA: Holliday junction DNA helicase RuvB C-terminal domain-containing protein [Deinococcales bacterium]|nr:Holliday junction DNA helicase RuvB C-terminal domain-containing protein [Deinococcales bacterium]
MQSGLLQRTSRGRIATPRAYEHLGLPVPEGQQLLFGQDGDPV